MFFFLIPRETFLLLPLSPCITLTFCQVFKLVHLQKMSLTGTVVTALHRVHNNFKLLFQSLYLCLNLFDKILPMKKVPSFHRDPIDWADANSCHRWSRPRFRKRGHAWTRLSFIDRRVDSITNPPTAMNVNRKPALVENYSMWVFPSKEP